MHHPSGPKALVKLLELWMSRIVLASGWQAAASLVGVVESVFQEQSVEAQQGRELRRAVSASAARNLAPGLAPAQLASQGVTSRSGSLQHTRAVEFDNEDKAQSIEAPT